MLSKLSVSIMEKNKIQAGTAILALDSLSLSRCHTEPSDDYHDHLIEQAFNIFNNQNNSVLNILKRHGYGNAYMEQNFTKHKV